MRFTIPEKHQWQEIKKIYLEAFPKRERKPYFMQKNLSRSFSQKGTKALLYAPPCGQTPKSDRNGRR